MTTIKDNAKRLRLGLRVFENGFEIRRHFGGFAIFKNDKLVKKVNRPEHALDFVK